MPLDRLKDGEGELNFLGLLGHRQYRIGRSFIVAVKNVFDGVNLIKCFKVSLPK